MAVIDTLYKGMLMATIIALTTLTDQGICYVEDTTQRADEFSNYAHQIGYSLKEVYWALEKHDVSVKDIYWIQDPYDGIIILDAPDAETAMSFFCIWIPLVICESIRFRHSRKKRCPGY